MHQIWKLYFFLVTLNEVYLKLIYKICLNGCWSISERVFVFDGVVESDILK